MLADSKEKIKQVLDRYTSHNEKTYQDYVDLLILMLKMF